MTLENTKFYTIKEICGFFNLDRRTIYKAIELGELSFFKVGSRYRFTEQQIKDWMGAKHE